MARRGLVCIQEWMSKNNCFGCGGLNDKGLGLRSFWDRETRTATAEWVAQPFHCAG